MGTEWYLLDSRSKPQPQWQLFTEPWKKGRKNKKGIRMKTKQYALFNPNDSVLYMGGDGAVGSKFNNEYGEVMDNLIDSSGRIPVAFPNQGTMQYILPNCLAKTNQNLSTAIAQLNSLTFTSGITSLGSAVVQPGPVTSVPTLRDKDGEELKIGDEVTISLELFNSAIGEKFTSEFCGEDCIIEDGVPMLYGTVKTPHLNPDYLGIEFKFRAGQDLEGAVTNNNGRWLLMKKIKKKKKPVKPIKLDLSHLDKLIIAEETKKEIVAVLKQHEKHAKLYTEWGLGETVEYGRGMTFLFHGGPGTGKTWGATQMARVIGQELLVIGAAEIQSQEPGGANRNIQEAFANAKQNKKVLLLDECDSLITSRAHVGMILSSEINTLLTEIEKFEGVCILATNRIGSLDEALERRIALIVEFPKPNHAQRIKIWETMLPKKMPLAKDVSAKELADYNLTGGQIKNVLLQAARLALSEDKDEVSLAHFEQAIDRVLKSKDLMGKDDNYIQMLGGDVDKVQGQKVMTKSSKIRGL